MVFYFMFYTAYTQYHLGRLYDHIGETNQNRLACPVRAQAILNTQIILYILVQATME